MNRVLRKLVPSLLAVSFLVSPLSVACQAPAETEEDLGSSSDALSLAEIRAAIVALDAATSELRVHIATLENDIAVLDTQNTAKLAEISSLVSSIEARKREVEERYERDRRNAMIFCFVGACNVGFVSLMMAFDNDDRLKQLQRDLDAARQQHQTANDQAEAFRTTKARLDERLATLRTTEDAVVALLAKRDAGPTKMVRLARRADRLLALKDNLATQVAALGEAKTLATALAVVIDAALVKVATASVRADKLAAESQAAVFELIRILAAGDPEAAAAQWLDKRIAKKTKETLDALGWSPEGFVTSLITRAFPGREKTAEAQLLRSQLLATITVP